MNILILQGHPDPNSSQHFDHALAAAYEQSARQAGHQVHVLRVAELGLAPLSSDTEWRSDPPEEVVRAQQTLAAADHLVMIFPLWLGTMPAAFKAFLEQVLRPAFAFGGEPQPGRHGALEGKSARVVITMGMPGLFYRWFYRAHAYHALRRNILKFCGVKPVRGTLIGLVDNERRRGRALSKLAKLGRRGL